MEPLRYTITSALPYTNGPVHIGQLSGAYVPADIYVRYLRLKYGRENVLFICGSDEHGVAIAMTAKKEGTTPQEVADKYNEIIKKSFKDFGIDFDIYHRTSSALHHETAADFFKTLYDKGEYLEIKTSEQYYDKENKEFLADRYITGTCPKCGNEHAYGDQCEKCGSALSPTELINPKSTISGNEPVLKETTHWYFKLDAMQSFLEEWIGEKSNNADEKWKKHVLGQCKSWLDGGLQARAITRDLEWGIKVPLEGAVGKVLYVWFDAPIGYISATKAWASEAGKDWEVYWKSKDTKLVHFIGKDNIVFHCLFFPAMLKAEGTYILPENVPANQFMNMEGQKMSTSRNWTVWLHEYLEEFPNQQDTLRYCLTANMPENKDSDFSWKDFQDRNNNELVANIGNLVNRVLVLTNKYFDGKLQESDFSTHEQDKNVLIEISETYKKVSQHIENYEFKKGLQAIMALSSYGNTFLSETEPWKLVKVAPERTGEILNATMQIVYHLSVLLQPFLPFTAQKIAKFLQLKPSDLNWKSDGLNLLEDGHQIGEFGLLFEKIEDDVIAKQLARLDAIKAASIKANTPQELTEVKEVIQFDDFVKLDIRIGTIVEAEKMPKSSKLLKLVVDIGVEKRTILSGIAKHFNPEKIVGQQVCVVANLAPRKMMGTESNGMVLTAEEPDGTLRFISPAETVINGSTIG